MDYYVETAEVETLPRIIYESVEAILARYIAIGESIGYVPGIQVYSIVGQQCAKCGKGPSYEFVRKRDEHGKIKSSQWRCASCEKPWVGKDIAVLKQHIDGSGSYRDTEERVVRCVDDHLHEWAILRRIVENRGRKMTQVQWDLGVIANLVYGDQGIDSIAGIVRYGKKFRPRYKWTEDRVRLSKGKVHRVIEARARKERLLADQWRRMAA